MTEKERWFAAFGSLVVKGVKVGDATFEQIALELDDDSITRHLFYQYRYLYRKEKGL